MYLISGCVILTCLFESATVRSDGECPFPRPPPWNDTEPVATKDYCSGRFRYKCKKDHVRKAGTSNLAKYSNLQWNKPSLECIKDPRIASTKQPDVPPSPTLHTPVTSIHSTKQSTNQTTSLIGGKSTTTHASQPTRHTTDQSSTAPGVPATVSTHADASLPTSTGLTPNSTHTTHCLHTTQGVRRNGQGSSGPQGEKLGSSGTPDPGPSEPKKPEDISGAAVPAGLSVMVLLVVCSSAGLGFCLWKRKMNNNIHNRTPESTPDEQILMNPMAQNHPSRTTS